MEKLLINGQGSVGTYGIFLQADNYPQLFKGQKVKMKYSYDWGDGNGLEIDPEEKTCFESITYTFNLLFICQSFADFTTKYDAFISALKAPNGSLWNFTELKKTYRLHLVEVGESQEIDVMRGKLKISVTLKNNWQ